MIALERLRDLADNPVVFKDGISRMRSWRAPLAASVYLALIGGIGLVAFAAATQNGGIYNRPVASTVGATVFAAMAIAQLVLICIFTPAMAAGAISGERERQTLDALLVSRMSDVSITIGKLAASLGYSFLLVLTALPLFSVVFLFGGVDLGQLWVAEVLTVFTAASLAAVSLFWSALFRRSLVSTVASYMSAFALTAGTALIAATLSIFTVQAANSAGVAFVKGGTAASAQPDVPWVWYLNPFYSLSWNLFSSSGFSSGVKALGDPWHATIAFQAVLGAVAIFFAVRLLRGRRHAGSS